MSDLSMTVEGEKVTSPSIAWVLKQLSRGKTELSLLDLAEIRSGELDKNQDGHRDKKDFYVDGSKQPKEVWKKEQVKWADFLNCSLYIDRLLSTPEQAMIVQKTDLSGFIGNEKAVFFIGFAKNFHDAHNIKTLAVPEQQNQRVAEDVSRYMVRVTFLKDGNISFQLIDRNTPTGQIYQTLSKLFQSSEKIKLNPPESLKFDLREGARLDNQLKEYLWQIVTKEGPFKEAGKS